MKKRKNETRRNGLLTALSFLILFLSCGNNDNPAGPNTQPPFAPDGLVATSTSTFSIQISWNSVEGATSYKIYRSLSADGSFLEIAAIAAISYSDNGLSSGTAYFYKIKAVNSAGESEFSFSATATTAQPDLSGNIVVTPYLDDTIPTAFVNHIAKLLADDVGGIASVIIQNNNSASVQLTVQCEVEGYTTQASKTITISGNSTDTVFLTPLVTATAFQNLTENKTVNYRTKVSLQSSGTSNEFYNQTHTAQMLAKDVFKFYDAQLYPLMALWVMPHVPEVEQLISRALARNPESSFIGYQSSPTQDGYQSIYIPKSGIATIAPGATQTYTFTKYAHYTNFSVSCSYSSDGGILSDDIVVSLKDLAGNAYYEPGRLTFDSFSKTLTSNTIYYYRLGNTTFGTTSTKTVAYSYNLSYTKDWIYAQTKAIYESLKYDYSIAYVNSPISYPGGSQRIRFPADALTLGSANCIDGTVLFASALENIALEPIIVLVPGHAFVGWKRWTGANNNCEFLETTMIGNSSYETAYSAGMDAFSEHQTAGDLITIDVKAARAVGLTPLMKRAVQ